MLKKKYICLFLVALLLLYIVFIKIYEVNPTAKYIYDNTENIIGIKFKDDIYEHIGFSPSKPYDFIYDENPFELKSYLVLHNDLSDFLFMWNTVCFFSDYYDFDNNFIRCDVWGRASPDYYVKEGFVYPTLHNNEVNEVWMSLSSSYEIIKDRKTVDKIVECAKSNGEIELDKEIVDYIKKYSADNHCLWLKYEGYPIVEEFQIEETEDGRYIVDQYTPEEYDTIYWEEEAHQ